MSSENVFGWELLHRTIQSEINSEADLIIALVHLFLTRNSSLRCIGVGDEQTERSSDSGEGSELLPNGWNANRTSYTLRYARGGQVFVLLGNVTEGLLVMNLLNAENKNISNLSLNISDTVKAKEGNLKTIIPDVAAILDRIKKELVDPVFSGNSSDITTQTTESFAAIPTASLERRPPNPDLNPPNNGVSNDDDPLRIRRPPQRNDFRQPQVDPLRDIGRGDLDPLGRGGGGMLFPSPGMPGAPIGGLPPFPHGPPGRPGLIPPPPGARFDPVGPPGTGFGNPNPDHFRPPSDYDDMYM